MTNPLVAKLEQFTHLSFADRRKLEQHSRKRIRRFGARDDILREGDRPHAINLILTGWACRYKQLAQGNRQIVALLLPGDLCDHDVVTLHEMDHSVAALTPVTLAEISREAFARTVHEHQRLARALAWDTLVTVAIQREWTVNIGQRLAVSRLAHLFCETYVRLRGLGLTATLADGGMGGSCEMPLTQTQIGEAIGLSGVHVNRSVQQLRAMGLIELRRKRLEIFDLAVLMAEAQFDPNYLHLGREGAQFDAGESERD